MKHSQDQTQSYGFAMRAEADKNYGKAVLFGSVLLLTHLLDVRPATVEALGLTVSLESPSILYGAVAAIFFNHAYKYVIAENRAQLYAPISPERRRARMLLRSTGPRRDPAARRERNERLSTILLRDRVAVLPYYALTGSIILFSFLLGISDFFGLVAFVIEHWDRIQAAMSPGV